MLKHRVAILEHQTSAPATMSDFTMENATNNSNLRFCLTVSPPQPPQAMIGLRLELGNKGFWGHHVASGEAMLFLKSVSLSANL
jgi:hypothetical protein